MQRTINSGQSMKKINWTQPKQAETRGGSTFGKRFALGEFHILQARSLWEKGTAEAQTEPQSYWLEKPEIRILVDYSDWKVREKSQKGEHLGRGTPNSAFKFCPHFQVSPEIGLPGAGSKKSCKDQKLNRLQLLINTGKRILEFQSSYI